MGHDQITLYYNPRCSKCRQAVSLLEEREVPHQLRVYLDDPPDRTELASLLQKLGTEDPRAIIRTKEDAYREGNLSEAGPDQLLDALVAHPALLERPIAVRGDRAVVARPPENLLDLL